MQMVARIGRPSGTSRCMMRPRLPWKPHGSSSDATRQYESCAVGLRGCSWPLPVRKGPAVSCGSATKTSSAVFSFATSNSCSRMAGAWRAKILNGDLNQTADAYPEAQFDGRARDRNPLRRAGQGPVPKRLVGRSSPVEDRSRAATITPAGGSFLAVLLSARPPDPSARATTLHRSPARPGATASDARARVLSARAPCAAARCRSQDRPRSTRCHS